MCAIKVHMCEFEMLQPGEAMILLATNREISSFRAPFTPTSVTLIVGTLLDDLPQQVWSLPQPVALSRLQHCLLEEEAIPSFARTGEDRGTAPHGRNDSAVPVNLQDEPRNGGRGPPRTLIVADTLVSPYKHTYTHFQSSADLKLQGKEAVQHHQKMSLTRFRSVLLLKRKNPFLP